MSFPLFDTAGGPLYDIKSSLTNQAPIVYLSPAALSLAATCADTLTLGHSAVGSTRFPERPSEARPPAQFGTKLPHTSNYHWVSYRVPASGSCLRCARASTDPQTLASHSWGSNLAHRIASRSPRLPLRQPGHSWGSNLGRRIASQPCGQEQLGLEPGPPDCKPAPWAGGGGKRKPFIYIERVIF